MKTFSLLQRSLDQTIDLGSYPNLHCYEREIRWHFHRLDSPRLSP